MYQKPFITMLGLAWAASMLMLSSCKDEAKNWPQFRGPNSNLVVTGKNLADEWGANKNIKWTYDISGEGFSSPIIWGDRIFIASEYPEQVKVQPQQGGFDDNDEGDGPDDGPDGNPEGDQNSPMGDAQGPAPVNEQVQHGPTPQGGAPGQMPGGNEEEDESYKDDVYRWEVTCIDLNSGKELWKQIAFKGHPRIKKHPQGTYANETPVTDGQRVYAYFGMIGLYCYDMNGKLLWQTDLGAYKTKNGFGTGSSPAIFNDKIFVLVDNDVSSFIVALDTKTGKQIWKTERDEKTTYSTPIIWKNKVRNELITCGQTARSYDPETGKGLWTLKMGGEEAISSPVADKNNLYIGNNDGPGDKMGTLFAVKAGASGDITPSEGQTISKGVAWSVVKSKVSSPSGLLYKGYIYYIGENGGKVTCYEAATGELVYQKKIEKFSTCWSSPWVQNDKIFVTDAKGVTQAFKPGPDFQLISRNTLDDKIWTMPAFGKNSLVLKGAKKIYCIGL
jgi:outer membrane protein assembly factor BamB